MSAARALLVEDLPSDAAPVLSDDPHPYAGVHPEDRAAPTRPALPANVRRHTELALRLARAIAAVDDAQHQPGAFAERSSSLVSDPTGDTIADPSRLRLRLAAISAEIQIERSARALEQALRTLEHATNRWSGVLR